MARSDERAWLKVVQVFEKRLDGSLPADQIYLLSGIRRALTIRYMAKHIHPDRVLAKESHDLLLRFAKRAVTSDAITGWQRILHLALIYCPGLYWAYRARQPGMLRWEIVERRRRRAKNAENN